MSQTENQNRHQEDRKDEAHPGRDEIKAAHDLAQKNLKLAQKELSACRAALAEAEELIAQQRDELAGKTHRIPRAFSLTVREADILGCLLQSPAALTRDQIYYRLTMSDMEPGNKLIDVYIRHLRVKLKPWNIEIATEWGRGWRLRNESRKLIRELADREAERDREFVQR